MIVAWTLLVVALSLVEPCYPHTGRTQYSLGFLLSLRDQQQQHTQLDLATGDLSPAEIFRQHENFNKTTWGEKGYKVRKRGRRGGVRQRLERLTLRCIPLPSMLLCNALFIKNKMDETQASVVHLEKFRDACLMAFTETWLTPEDLNTDLTLTGFGTLVRIDRDLPTWGNPKEAGSASASTSGGARTSPLERLY